jgi:cytochrome c oxidase subunit 1
MTPILFAFANLILPLQIGAPDVAFPRLNAFSFWAFAFGGIIVVSGFLTPGGAADFGWFAYTPLSDAIHSPGAGGDLWIMGLVLAGLGTILGAVNMITTVVCLRAPGMTMFRMPIFTWNIFVTSLLVLLAFPILTAALLGLEADRRLGAHVFDPANGGTILWQHLFWFFGHPAPTKTTQRPLRPPTSPRRPTRRRPTTPVQSHARPALPLPTHQPNLRPDQGLRPTDNNHRSNGNLAP